MLSKTYVNVFVNTIPHSMKQRTVAKNYVNVNVRFFLGKYV